MFTLKMADHYGNHRCHAANNVPIAIYFANELKNGAESLGIETTNCLCCQATKFTKDV